MNDFEINASTKSRTNTASRCCCSVWVTVETERYENTSVITVPQWEDYIVLGTIIDEGEGTRPILLLWQSSQIDSYSIPLVIPKARTRRPRSLGVGYASPK